MKMFNAHLIITKKTHSYRLVSVRRAITFSLVIIILITGCSNNFLSEETPTEILPTPTSAITEQPELPTENQGTLGTVENPWIMTYIIPETDLFDQVGLQSIVDQILLETGISINVVMFDSPREAFESLRAGEVHFIWMHPLTYLAAYERDLVTPQLVSNHYGLYQYGTMILANRASGFASYFNEDENEMVADDLISLRQFEGRRPCYISSNSLSGNMIPEGYFAINGIETLPAVITQSSSATVRALYIKGICDFGATFAFTGDPRTSAQVINDLPDAMSQIQIIWRSEAVIPSLTFVAANTVPQEIADQINTFMLQTIQKEDGKQLFTRALQYDIQDFMPVRPDFFNEFTYLVYAAKIVPYQYLGY